ncbi:hypothetical protein ACFSQ7_28960 [Paenibacillus rhizoplanae]
MHWPFFHEDNHVASPKDTISENARKEIFPVIAEVFVRIGGLQDFTRLKERLYLLLKKGFTVLLLALLLLSGSITAFAAEQGSVEAGGVTPSGIPLTGLEAFCR